MNWKAQTILNHWPTPVPLSGCPRGLIRRQSLLRKPRQSLSQANPAPTAAPLLPDSHQSHRLCICVSCRLYLLVPKATIATKTNTCSAMLCVDAGNVLCSLFYLYIACADRFLIYSEIDLVIINQFRNTH